MRITERNMNTFSTILKDSWRLDDSTIQGLNKIHELYPNSKLIYWYWPHGGVLDETYT